MRLDIEATVPKSSCVSSGKSSDAGAALCRDDGVGLAAPQVGVNVRLMVFNALGVRGEGEELVLANPRVISSSSETDLQEVSKKNI
jgi:peptide deformylase